MADKAAEGQTISSAFADNECAQALLELAESSPINGSLKTSVEVIRDESQQTPASSVNGSSDCGITKISDGHGSILKRQLEEVECQSLPTKMSTNYDPSVCFKMACRSKEELRKELAKRICLDHNYAQQHHSVLKARRSWPEPKQTTPKNLVKGLHSCKSVESSRNSPPYTEQTPVCDASMGVSSLSKEQMTPSVRSEKEGSSTDTTVPKQDLYQQEENKYKNLNILYKCLQPDVNTDNSHASHKDPVDLKKKTANYHNASCQEERRDKLLNVSTTENSEYKCPFCPRVFQQNCYMLKHTKRMHAASVKEEREKKTNDVTCPICERLIQRDDFVPHSLSCSQKLKNSKKQLEAKLANCQFCGILMRRELLILHLAQEHCGKNVRVLGGASVLTEGLDSDSSTVSGSEHELDDDDDGGGDGGGDDGVIFGDDAYVCDLAKDGLQLTSTEATVVRQTSDVELQALREDSSTSPTLESKTTHSFAEQTQSARCKELALSRFLCVPTSPDSLRQQFLSNTAETLQLTDSSLTIANSDCHSCPKSILLQDQKNSGRGQASNNNYPELSQRNDPFSGCLSEESGIQKFMPAASLLVAPSLQTNIMPNT